MTLLLSNHRNSRLRYPYSCCLQTHPQALHMSHQTRSRIHRHQPQQYLFHNIFYRHPHTVYTCTVLPAHASQHPWQALYSHSLLPFRRSHTVFPAHRHLQRYLLPLQPSQPLRLRAVTFLVGQHDFPYLQVPAP